MSAGKGPSTSERGPRGIPGRWVVLAIFIISILGSTLALLIIRPVPGAEPVERESRPFGPATRGDQGAVPLINRGGNGE